MVHQEDTPFSLNKKTLIALIDKVILIIIKIKLKLFSNNKTVFQQQHNNNIITQ